MRQNIFIRVASGDGDYGSDWRLYVGAVTSADAQAITAALESDGELVRRFSVGRTLGRLIYESPKKVELTR